MKERKSKKTTLFESVASRFSRLFHKEEDDDKVPQPPIEPQEPDAGDTAEGQGPETARTAPAWESKTTPGQPAPEVPTPQKPTPEKTGGQRRRKIIPRTVAERVAAGQKKEKSVSITNLPDEEVGPAIRDYVVEHISDELLSVETLAQGLKISRTGLYALVHRKFGVTPAHYILDLRLKHAIALLETGMKVREAAIKSGFADPKYFGKVLKRHYGILPSRVGVSGFRDNGLPE